MLRKLSIILALAAALAVPSAAMARGGGGHGGGGHGGWGGGGWGHGGGWGGFHGGGFARYRGYGGWGGGGYGGDWGDYWPFYGYDDSYSYPYYNQPVYYVVHVHHNASRCHNVNHSIWHRGVRYWRTVRVCHR